ncbi:hypothetical protein GQ600_5664 [Phytophthora cactorum]|nr:hypothetical protein GQ600_5664 [Phytophthora cactorum]
MTKEEYVWQYVRNLHPKSWTVVGICEASPEETKWLDENWKNVSSYSCHFPLFGNWVVARHDVTPHAFKLFSQEKKQVTKQTIMPANAFDAFDRNGVAGGTEHTK